ncbi:MAG: 50S ribosomal protein L18 [Nitrospirae bacterium]|nr:50S ribosomal protein L18 [Nitrospirota bacterium]
MADIKKEARHRRHERIRKKVYGTSEKPRLNVFKSLNHIYAQIVNDAIGSTLVSASSIDKELREKIKTGGNVSAAKEVGALLAQRATKEGIKKIVFDRAGYPYHGRIKALAEASRETGLEF